MKLSLALAALVVAALLQPALGQKDKDDKPGRGGGPDKAMPSRGNDGAPGQGRGQGPGQGQGQGARGSQPAAPGNIVVGDRDRNAVYTYYRNDFAAGNCPPGLARKNNGCLPPGQAKKLWAVGQPLPGSVVFHPLPGPLLMQLTPAPGGYQYVRVANDILLMAIGTRMITAAIADLGSM